MLKVRPHRRRAEQDNPFPRPTSSAEPDASQGTAGPFGCQEQMRCLSSRKMEGNSSFDVNPPNELVQICPFPCAHFTQVKGSTTSASLGHLYNFALISLVFLTWISLKLDILFTNHLSWCLHKFHNIVIHNFIFFFFCRAMLMTACDLSAITKPWPVQQRVYV